MVDWLHCNTCFIQPGPVSDGRTFLLTSCGHVFCDKCQDKGWKQKCLTCGAPTPSTIKLTSKLAPPVDAYFADPQKMMQQLLAETKQLIVTYQFQDSQRKRLIKWLTNNATNQAGQDKERMKVLERENCKLREENTCMRKVLEERTSEINYFKRLLSEKSPGNCLRSPSNDRVLSPAHRAFGHNPSPLPHNPYAHSIPMSSSLSSLRQSPSSITPGRVSMRMPPSGGRLGRIPSPQSRSSTPGKEFCYTPTTKDYSYTPTSKGYSSYPSTH